MRRIAWVQVFSMVEGEDASSVALSYFPTAPAESMPGPASLSADCQTRPLAIEDRSCMARIGQLLSAEARRGGDVLAATAPGGYLPCPNVWAMLRVKSLRALLLVMAAQAASGCIAPHGVPVAASRREVEVTGWLHVVWDDGMRLFVVAPDGTGTPVVLADSLAQPYGGALALDRQWVHMAGRRDGEPPNALRVTRIVTVRRP